MHRLWHEAAAEAGRLLRVLFLRFGPVSADPDRAGRQERRGFLGAVLPGLPSADMPRADARTFGDLIGKLDHLEIVCPKCDRFGRYLVHRLAMEYGPHFKLPDWIALMTRNFETAVVVARRWSRRRSSSKRLRRRSTTPGRRSAARGAIVSWRARPPSL
jgi:hypothetical protein